MTAPTSSDTQQKSADAVAVPVPSQWPPQVGELYEPVRELGRGGFASVMLAKKKNQKSKSFAAMKIVGSKDPTRQEVGYARREIDILQELDHPNIMKLLEWYKPPSDNTQCAAVMALSYHKGPTLEALLKLGGKLSLLFGRVVAAQLVDAVAYLHSRAVMHRDIKPDNVVVTGAFRSQDEIWDDVVSTKEEPDFTALLQKWQVTLIDFGFARALTPDDMKKKLKNLPETTATAGTGMDNSQGGLSSSGRSLNRSMSKRFTRKMSAIGNRMYAAPEITKGIEKNLDRSKHNAITASHHSSVDVTRTLSDHVSYYGMMVDAFSIGNTIKYMLTGVPPGQDVNTVIAGQKHPMARLGRFLGKKLANNKNNTVTRKVKYRAVKDIPPEVVRLIQGCTHHDAQQRTSVRTARLYPWIDDVLCDGREAPSTQQVSYLTFVLKTDKGGSDEKAIEPIEAVVQAGHTERSVDPIAA